MAELSHGVAVLAEGVAMMETTLVGVVQVDPRRLLEDGVRRELVSLVARTLHEGLTFNTRLKVFHPILEIILVFYYFFICHILVFIL